MTDSTMPPKDNDQQNMAINKKNRSNRNNTNQKNNTNHSPEKVASQAAARATKPPSLPVEKVGNQAEGNFNPVKNSNQDGDKNTPSATTDTEVLSAAVGKNVSTPLKESVESTKPTAATSSKTGKPEANQAMSTKNSGSREKARFGFNLSLLAIALVISLGVGLYYHAHTQVQSQQLAIQTLETKIQMLQLSQSQTSAPSPTELNALAELQTQQQQQQQSLEQLEKDITVQANQFNTLQSKVTALSETDNNLWLVSQANFLVSQASRKLHNEGDVVTAEVLLRNADISVAEMNDPHMLDIRKAITQDIATLAGTGKIDIDGIMLQLNQMSNQLDRLPLLHPELNNVTGTSTEKRLVTDSISDWRQNLSNSWKSFMDGFITVTPRVKSDVNGRPELTSNQSAYLRENIRLQLFIATMAVPRGQNELYQQALTKAGDWAKTYYDPASPLTQAFITQLDTLAKNNVHVDIPTQLTSQPLLKKIMQTRVQNLLTQNSANSVQEG